MGWNNENDTDDTGASDELGFDLDKTEAQEAQSFELLKRGEYPLIVTGAESKASKNTEGARFVALEVTIVAGPGKGRKVWGNFTTHHPTSAKAVQIGRGQLKALYQAVGVASSSLADLVAAQVPVTGVIGVEKERDGYDPRNDIRGFKALTKEHAALLEGGEAAPAESAKGAPAKPAGKKPSFLK